MSQEDTDVFNEEESSAEIIGVIKAYCEYKKLDVSEISFKVIFSALPNKVLDPENDNEIVAGMFMALDETGFEKPSYVVLTGFPAPKFFWQKMQRTLEG